MTITTKENAAGKISGYYVDGKRVAKKDLEAMLTGGSDEIITVDYSVASALKPMSNYQVMRNLKVVVTGVNNVRGGTLMTLKAVEAQGLELGSGWSGTIKALWRVNSEAQETVDTAAQKVVEVTGGETVNEAESVETENTVAAENTLAVEVAETDGSEDDADDNEVFSLLPTLDSLRDVEEIDDEKVDDEHATFNQRAEKIIEDCYNTKGWGNPVYYQYNPVEDDGSNDDADEPSVFNLLPALDTLRDVETENTAQAHNVTAGKFLVSVYNHDEHGNGAESANVETAQQAAQFVIDFAKQNFDKTVTGFYIKKFGKGHGEYRSTDADLAAIDALIDPAGKHIYEQYKELCAWIWDYIGKCDCTQEQAEKVYVTICAGECDISRAFENPDYAASEPETATQEVMKPELAASMKLAAEIIASVGEGEIKFSHAGVGKNGGLARHYDLDDGTEFGTGISLVEVFTDKDGYILDHVNVIRVLPARIVVTYDFATLAATQESVVYINGELRDIWNYKYRAGIHFYNGHKYLVEMGDGKYVISRNDFFKIMALCGVYAFDKTEFRPTPNNPRGREKRGETKTAEPFDTAQIVGEPSKRMPKFEAGKTYCNTWSEDTGRPHIRTYTVVKRTAKTIVLKSGARCRIGTDRDGGEISKVGYNSYIYARDIYNTDAIKKQADADKYWDETEREVDRRLRERKALALADKIARDFQSDEPSVFSLLPAVDSLRDVEPTVEELLPELGELTSKIDTVNDKSLRVIFAIDTCKHFFLNKACEPLFLLRHKYNKEADTIIKASVRLYDKCIALDFDKTFEHLSTFQYIDHGIRNETYHKAWEIFEAIRDNLGDTILASELSKLADEFGIDRALLLQSEDCRFNPALFAEKTTEPAPVKLSEPVIMDYSKFLALNVKEIAQGRGLILVGCGDGETYANETVVEALGATVTGEKIMGGMKMYAIEQIFDEKYLRNGFDDEFSARESELKENIGFALDATADAAAKLAFAKNAYDNAQFQFNVAEDTKIKAEQSYREFVFSEAERLNKLPIVDKVCNARDLRLTVTFDIKAQLFKIEHGNAPVAGAKITLGAFKTPAQVEAFLQSLLSDDKITPPVIDPLGEIDVDEYSISPDALTLAVYEEEAQAYIARRKRETLADAKLAKAYAKAGKVIKITRRKGGSMEWQTRKKNGEWSSNEFYVKRKQGGDLG